ncbi:MAG: glycine cleavage system protein GcvH [Methanomassiliicoccales archaeon]|nr:glycine cleavage system protein GcvH [Methanomassiliicoccales archaeon]NYT14571.1 glycine cleavage system protein GcvH [Methanomassiliicoccales archaeon]
MSEVRDGLLYSEEHEWIKVEGDIGKVGITDHAQKEMNDILYAEVPEVGRKVKKGETIGAIESVKTVADVYTPVSGVVIEVNSELEDSPQFINESPYDKGWFAIIRIEYEDELDELMDAEDYADFIGV